MAENFLLDIQLRITFSPEPNFLIAGNCHSLMSYRSVKMESPRFTCTKTLRLENRLTPGGLMV